MWNAALKPALHLSDVATAQLAEMTAGFSFAYLKELFLSSMMRWIASPQAGAMGQLMADQVDILREQMVSASALPEVTPDNENGGTPVRRIYISRYPSQGGKRLR